MLGIENPIDIGLLRVRLRRQAVDPGQVSIFRVVKFTETCGKSLDLDGSQSIPAIPGTIIDESLLKPFKIHQGPPAARRGAQQLDQRRGGMLIELIQTLGDGVLSIALPQQDGRPYLLATHRRTDPRQPVHLDQGGDRLEDQAPYDRITTRIGSRPFLADSCVLARVFMSIHFAFSILHFSFRIMPL